MFQCCDLNNNQDKKTPNNIRYFKITHIKTRKYTIKYNNKNDSSVKSYNFIHHSSSFESNKYSWLDVKCYKTSNDKIALYHIINKNCKSNYTLIVSKCSLHDLSYFYPTALDFSTQLKINIISYDYSGYGISEGEQNHTSIIRNIEEVISFCVNSLSISLERMIIVGHSIGSLPSINICSNKLYSKIRGLVLISSFSLETKLYVKDRLDSVIENSSITREQLRKIECPVFLIHGLNDQIIPFKEMNKMLKYFKNVYTWFPPKGTHDNIFTFCRMNFLMQMNIYINSLSSSKLTSTQTSSINFKFRFEDDDLMLTKYKSSEIKNRLFETKSGSKRLSDDECIVISEDNESPFPSINRKEEVKSDYEIIKLKEDKLNV